jgi:hypothetical protein
MTSLLDLLAELEGKAVPLTVGGGFGLYLKRRHLEQTGERTLLTELPEPRATNDIDLFLRAEVLADAARTTELALAIERQGYAPVEEAKYLQWKRPVRVGEVDQEVKIDVLVGPYEPFRQQMKVKSPRVRPRALTVPFHAHEVLEAVGIDEGPLQVRVAGRRSDGSACEGVVFVPQAFPYLLMKLHAFNDRKNDEDKDQGRHHALDLYTIVGMMTAQEYEEAVRRGREHDGDEQVARARSIVREHFGTPTSLGMLRLREHRLFRGSLQLEEFGRVLREVLVGGEPEPPGTL